MIFGERTEEEFQLVLENDFTCFINDIEKRTNLPNLPKK